MPSHRRRKSPPRQVRIYWQFFFPTSVPANWFNTMLDGDITSNEFTLLAILSGWCIIDQDCKWCPLSDEQISRRIGVRQSVIAKMITNLETAELIHVEHRIGNPVRRYIYINY